jgi:hypothetical protein
MQDSQVYNLHLTASVVYWSEFPGFRPRGLGFYSWRCQIFRAAVGLERGPLSLVRINEELLERKVAALEN